MKINIEITDCPNIDHLLKHLKRIADNYANHLPDGDAKRKYLISEAKNAIEEAVENNIDNKLELSKYVNSLS